jgi:hypothetical protein
MIACRRCGFPAHLHQRRENPARHCRNRIKIRLSAVEDLERFGEPARGGDVSAAWSRASGPDPAVATHSACRARTG